MCISFSKPPPTRTAATPSTDSKARFTCCSAYKRNRFICATLKLDVSLCAVSPSLITGSKLGLKRRSLGFSISRGSCKTSSFSRTSKLAKSMSVPHANESTTSDWPARDVDVTLRTPFTTPMASSMGFETSCSTSPGAAPS